MRIGGPSKPGSVTFAFGNAPDATWDQRSFARTGFGVEFFVIRFCWAKGPCLKRRGFVGAGVAAALFSPGRVLGATVKGSGSRAKPGKHGQPLAPNGKLDIIRDAGA